MTGVWLVGARGNVATLTTVGARAIARDLVAPTGLVTERSPVDRLELPALADLVIGGHEVTDGTLAAAARRHHERNGLPGTDVLETVEPDLEAVDERIRPGTAVNTGDAVTADGAATVDSAREAVDRIRDDIAAFRDREGLERVVVVNVASTEPRLESPQRYGTREALEAAIETDDPALPASVLYATAAIEAGHPFCNFTPSPANAVEGVRELALERDVPHAGRDGKTGETLVKSALAPLFAGRNLRVLSWEGHNILGNEDGRVLEAPENEAGKLESKGGVLESLLPDLEHNAVRIDYTPSLGDRKTAWDFVHFEGFLGAEMSLQFTWQASDSALAAPLVIDLVRLLAHADEHGEGGLQPQLASFFKDPIGVDEHDLSAQFDLLERYVNRHAGEP